MLVQKLFTAQKKQFTTKPQYTKRTYKSYKELLQLDRPRKKIQYSSQSQDEDFLQKLLNAQNERAKQKKKRKKSLNSARKRQSQQKNRQQIMNAVKQEGKMNSILNSELKFKRDAQSRGGSAQKRPFNELSLIQQQKHQNIKEMQLRPVIKQTKKTPSKTLQKIPTQKETIYIDNKSIQSPPIIYSSTNHLFHPSLTNKKNTAYEVLLKQKEQYLQPFKPKQLLDSHMNHNKIQHNLNQIIDNKFSFRPVIEPINPNWRYNLTIAPKMFTPEREFVDRKTLFRSKDQQQRFIMSLRQISRRKQ